LKKREKRERAVFTSVLFWKKKYISTFFLSSFGKLGNLSSKRAWRAKQAKKRSSSSFTGFQISTNRRRRRKQKQQSEKEAKSLPLSFIHDRHRCRRCCV
jgi:hypothetical protein